jgi:hypothetical protein
MWMKGEKLLDQIVFQKVAALENLDEKFRLKIFALQE